MTYDAEWTREWPTEDGSYWFFGYTSAFCRTHERAPRLVLIYVRRVSNGILYMVEGNYTMNQTPEGMQVHPNDTDSGAVGFWTPTVLPSTHNLREQL